MSQRLSIAAGLAALLVLPFAGWFTWPLIGDLAAHTAVLPTPTRVDYIVVPHPGDEFQAWSLIEDDPTSYKVFILATRGEESSSCEPGAHRRAWQPRLEPPADPVPRGRWTASCEKAALGSWVRFFTEQARSDPTLPSALRHTGSVRSLPDDAGRVCRKDGDKPCRTNTSAEVWVDEVGRGALVAFDLGHGDLTRLEVAWAVRTVRQHRAELGLDISLSNGGLIGAAFANRAYDCVEHTDPDHRAVHEALYETDFNLGFQAAATCADDPDVAWSRVVSPASADAAFAVAEDGTRTGSHTAAYGWMSRSPARLDRRAQRSLFHTHQEFWVRFADPADADRP